MTTHHTTTQQGATPIVVLPRDVYATPATATPVQRAPLRGRDAGGSVHLPDGGPPAGRSDVYYHETAEAPALALDDQPRRRRSPQQEGH